MYLGGRFRSTTNRYKGSGNSMLPNERGVPGGMTKPPLGFKIFYSGGVFTTNIASIVAPANTEGAAGVTTYYVDKATGSDTTGNGTSGNPYKSINKALLQLNAVNAVAGIVKIKGGRYNRDQGWKGQGCNCLFLDVVSWDGVPVYSTLDYPSLTWALDSGATYVATSDSGNASRSSFWDKKYLNADGDYQRLSLAADLATCRATPQTYFVSGTSMYVHLSDGRSAIGDPDLVAFDSNLTNALYVKPGGRLYMENIRFEGGAYAFQCNMFPNVDSTITLLNKDCWFKYGASGAIARDSVYSILANAKVFHWNSVVAFSIQDGAGYDPAQTGHPPPQAVEVGCDMRWNGYTSSGANQGSTVHTLGASITRVGGRYHHNQDCQIQDVTGTKSWNLGVTADTTQTADAAIGVGFALAADTGSEMWLDSCTTSNGVNPDLLCGSGVKMHTYNHTPAIPVTTGAGTIDSYTPPWRVG